jgi:hypothetical protein
VKSLVQSLHNQKVLYTIDIFLLLTLIDCPSLVFPHLTFTRSELIDIFIRCILRNKITFFALKYVVLFMMCLYLCVCLWLWLCVCLEFISILCRILLQEGYFHTLCSSFLFVIHRLIQYELLTLRQWTVQLSSLLFILFPTLRDRVQIFFSLVLLYLTNSYHTNAILDCNTQIFQLLMNCILKGTTTTTSTTNTQRV